MLLVDLFDEPGREFRAAADSVYIVERNLAISNMYFAEFALCVYADGIHRYDPDSG